MSGRAAAQLEVIHIDDSYWCFHSSAPNERACICAEDYFIKSVSENTVTFDSTKPTNDISFSIDLLVKETTGLPEFDLSKELEFDQSFQIMRGVKVEHSEAISWRDSDKALTFDFYVLRYLDRGAAVTLTGSNLINLKALAESLLCYYPHENGLENIGGVISIKEGYSAPNWQDRIEKCHTR